MPDVEATLNNQKKKVEALMGEQIADVLKFLIGGVVLSAVVAAPAACTVHEDAKIAEMVRSGSDPLRARCAIRSGVDTRAMCRTLAERGEK